MSALDPTNLQLELADEPREGVGSLIRSVLAQTILSGGMDGAPGSARAGTFGAVALAQLHGRRHDPYHPAAAGERNYNPLQPRDPGGDHGGEWVKGPASAAKAAAKLLGRISEDDFYEAHGEDYYDQYGSPDLGAILWKDGTASLYQDLDKGKVRAFGDIDSSSARRLSGDLKWAAGQPETGDPGGGKLAGHRQTDLGSITAEVGYGYNGDGDLIVRVTMPPVGNDRKPTTIDLEDLDMVESFASDLDTLADDIDSGAYTGDTPGLSRPN